MPEKFLTIPASSLDGNNLPNNLTGAVLSATTSVTGLTNGVAYRTFVLQNPSPEYTPTAPGISYIGSADSGASSATSSKTFTGVSIGAADANRTVIVCIAACLPGAGGTNDTFSSVTIGGISATKRVVATGGDFLKLAIYTATVTSGTTADIVVTFTENHDDCVVFVYRGVGLSTFTPTATASGSNNANPRNANLTTPAGGSVVGIHIALNVNQSASDPFTGISRSAFQDIRSNEFASAGMFTPTVSETRTIQAADSAAICTMFVS